MKQLFFLIIIVVIFAVGYFFISGDLTMNEVKNWTSNIAEEITNKTEKVEPRTLVNTNADSPIAGVHQNEQGVKTIIYTKQGKFGEMIEKIVIENREGETVEMYLNEAGKLAHFMGANYEIYFNNYKKDTFGAGYMILPDGPGKYIEEIPIPKDPDEVSWLVNTAHANTAQKIDMKLPGRGDRLDGKYYFETAGTAWNVVACAGGLLTEIIPNPISTFAATVGCGSLIARSIPAEEVNISGCDQAENVYNCVVSKVVGSNEELFLHGQVITFLDDMQTGVRDVDLAMTDKKMRTIKMKSDDRGYFSFPIGLARAYTITAKHPELGEQTFQMAISDERILIKDQAGETVYNQADYKNKANDFIITMEENNVYKANFSSRDPLNLSKNIKGDIDGTIEIRLENGEYTCELNMKGYLKTKMDGDQAYDFDGPVSARSTECERINDKAQLILIGKLDGAEPLPKGITMEFYKSMPLLADMMGPMEGTGFKIVASFDGDIIKGEIQIPRFSFQGDNNSYIEFTASRF